MRAVWSIYAACGFALGCSLGSPVDPPTPHADAPRAPADSGATEPPDAAVAEPVVPEAGRPAAPPPDAAAPPPDAAAPPPDAAPTPPDAAAAPPDAAAPPFDAGVDEPVEIWAPTPGPWEGYPAHPFRAWVDSTVGYGALAASSDGRVVLAASEDSLAVFDPERPDEEALVARLPWPTEIAEIAVSADGRMAALAAGDLVLVDLEDLHRPVVLGSLALAQPATSVALTPDDATVLVANDAELLVVDVRVPAAPRVRSALPGRRLANLVVATDGRVAFASDPMGVVALDLSDLAAPSVVGRIEGRGVGSLALSADSERLLVGRWAEIAILDVRDPGDPVLLGRWRDSVAGHPHAIALSADEQVAFVLKGGALMALDVSDPRAPDERGTFELQANATGAALIAEARALISTEGGLLSLELRDPSHQALLGRLELMDGVQWRAADVQLSPVGDVAYVAGEQLLVVDVVDPRAPRVAAIVDRPAGTIANLALAADGQTLLAASEAAMLVLDVGAPRAPVIIGAFDEPSADPMDIAMPSGAQTVFLATDLGGGLDVLDLSDPDEPRLLANLYVRHTRSVVLSTDERTAFLSDPYERGLLAIDVGDPRAPVLVGGLALAMDELAISPDGRTLAATSDVGVLIIDVADPVRPTHLATVELARGRGDIAFSPDGASLFVADGVRGVRVFDMTVPAAPILLATFDTPGVVTDLAVSADAATLAVLAEDASPVLGLVDVSRTPTLEPLGPPVMGAWRYVLRWADRYPDHPEHIAWRVTGGEVVISAIDQAAATAVVEWTPPDGGLEEASLVIAVGNHHYFELAHAAPPDRP